MNNCQLIDFRDVTESESALIRKICMQICRGIKITKYYSYSKLNSNKLTSRNNKKHCDCFLKSKTSMYRYLRK